MAAKKEPATASAGADNTRKRKDPPRSATNSQQSSKRGHDPKRVKMFDARAIVSQRADSALNNGELDLQAFLKSREFEIKALQDGMERSKSSRSSRAFQQVPRDLRRRTASHNVKRVPKRLQRRAAREMKEDNTPTVQSNKRKPGTARGRLRAETAKRLGLLAERKRKQKLQTGGSGIDTRAARPKIRKDKLNDPPKPKSKFRKRQIHKTWLPTHLWLAKRAKMTEPKKPLWRFSIPITSTEKSYRPTHRAGGAKGAIAWDMSYMSTIGLEGTEGALEKVLRAVGVLEQGIWDKKGEKWRSGKRSWTGWLSREVCNERIQVGPSTVFWCPSAQLPAASDAPETKPAKPPKRKLFIRIHPCAFLETWNELLRLSKFQRPVVHAEDLRFEIGSIDITGPGSTETLLGILHPYIQTDNTLGNHAETFKSLAGVTNPASLPSNSLLSFPIMDPRLRYPPRPVNLPDPNDEEQNIKLLELLSTWPVDSSQGSTALFDREERFKATILPSQKALNRRKSLARPGHYASITTADPQIPITLLTSRTISSSASQGTWTLLAPWKCILPIWYGLVHYPLSSGGNPRFGGLDELRQIHFEQGVPWFPADYPGTPAGREWEAAQRMIRKTDWDRRPKGKRVEWESLDLGARRKGELGRGWACDFERLFGYVSSPEPSSEDSTKSTNGAQHTDKTQPKETGNHLSQLPVKTFMSLLSSPEEALPPASTLSTIRLTLVSRGVPIQCARIYRLPSSTTEPEPEPPNLNSPPKPATRNDWLSLLPLTSHSRPLPNPKSINIRNRARIPLNVPLPQRIRLLAESLIRDQRPYPPENEEGDGHLLIPDEEDLIGFVTTGAFNLAEGKGVAVGAVATVRVLESLRREGKAGRLCIVRNSGERVGRLARWEPV